VEQAFKSKFGLSVQDQHVRFEPRGRGENLAVGFPDTDGDRTRRAGADFALGYSQQFRAHCIHQSLFANQRVWIVAEDS
jgi:hypothetical protein